MFNHHPALIMLTTPCFICVLYTYLLRENNALLDTYTTSYTCNEKIAHNTSRLLALDENSDKKRDYQGVLTMSEWLGANCPGARDARVGRFSCFLFNARTLFCRATICRRACQRWSSILTTFTLATDLDPDLRSPCHPQT